MKNIYLNLKRFDVPRADGGVNDLAYGNDYADAIVKKLESLDGVDPFLGFNTPLFRI